MTKIEAILIALLLVAIVLNGCTIAYVGSITGQLSDKMAAISSGVGDLKDTTGKLSAATGDLRDTTADLAKTMKDMAKATKDLAGAVGAFEARFKTIEERLGGLEERLGGLEERLGAVEERLKPKPPPAKVTEFHIAGGWPLPPAYHGNPFGPGGVGAARWFVYEPLFYYLPGNNTFIPRLGVSYEEKEGGKVLVVHLRRGVYWHDGKPFTSKDVKTSLTLAYAIWGWDYKYVEKIETPDDYTVVFHLTSPSPLYKVLILGRPILAADHIFGKWYDKASEIVELKRAGKTDEAKEKLKDLTKEVTAFKPGLPTGTGPYVLKKVTASEMYLEKFDKHWAADKVLIDVVRIYRWTSNEVVWAYLMAGKLDASHPATPKDVTEEIMKVQPKTRLVLPSDLGTFAVAFNFREGQPWRDLNLRKAVLYAVDRRKVREVCYYYAKDVAPYNHGILPSFEEQWLPEDFLAKLTKYEYDPEKAAKILTDAGYKKINGKWHTPEGKPIEFELWVHSGYSDWVLAAQEIARQLNDFGFSVKVRPVPGETFWPGIRTDDFNQLTMEWGAVWWGTGHPYTGYYRLYLGDTYKTSRFPADKAYDTPWGPLVPSKLTEQLAAETDPEKQKDLVMKLAYITNEYLPVMMYLEKRIMIFHVDGVRVTGWPLSTDPVWTIAPGGIERFYVILITKGILKPVE